MEGDRRYLEHGRRPEVPGKWKATGGAWDMAGSSTMHIKTGHAQDRPPAFGLLVMSGTSTLAGLVLGLKRMILTLGLG